MNPSQHARVMQILAEAMEVPSSRRAGFLDSTCHGEPELRREVEDLLECAEPAERAFDVASQEIARPDPDQIGPYANLEAIGEGGMAIVYRARQQHPVQRTVALKLIKLGMDTRQFVARFEAERQALAVMDHPGVARVYDAGSTDTGRPYFVMEYVDGRPILEYCDACDLPVRARLALFADVCDAVEHAHRKGIIHRDLKDTNVLIAEVDGRPQPKVIDFGVAKALQQPLTDRPLHTEHGQLLGTPEYMSPEQAERGAADVDTRADVYSLGVLLYELVAGVQPFPPDVLRSAGYEQVRRVIRDTEPARPSTRLSALARDDAARVAQRRRTALPALVRDLRNELEWIPMKAMRKGREQRYRSAAELADDVRNYLDGRPLIAGPESKPYRLRKFLARHKAGVAALVAMVLLLIGGIAATALQAVRATHAERLALEQKGRADREADAARKQAAVARSVNALMTDMIGKANRVGEKGDPDVTVRAVMDAAAAELDAPPAAKDASPQPEVEAALRHAIGQTYDALGLYDEAERLLRRAVDQRLGLYGEASEHVADSRAMLALVLYHKGDLRGAEGLCRELLAFWRDAHGDEHPDTLRSMTELARVLQMQGKLVEAEELCRAALESSLRVHGEEHPHTNFHRSGLSAMLIRQGRFAQAEPLSREALRFVRTASGDDHPDTIRSVYQLAFLLHRQGKLGQAEPLYREAFERSQRVFGAANHETLATACNYGILLENLGRFPDAEPLFAELYRRVPLTQGNPVLLAEQFSFYGTCLASQGKYEQADRPLREAYERLVSAGMQRHSRTRAVVKALVDVCDRTRRPDEAAEWRAKLAKLEAVTQPGTELRRAPPEPDPLRQKN